jgi:outer membrane protein OmpA-like peptidoglycan-associated protein
MMMTRLTHLLSCLFVVAAFTGCQTTPPSNASLENARRLVQQAGTDPNVTRSAELELSQARQALARAEEALRSGENESEVNHLAYLAGQRAQVALYRGNQRMAENRVGEADLERARIRVAARTQEAQQAQTQARQAQQQTQMAQADTQLAQAQAQTQAARAEQLQKELEKMSAQQPDRGMVVMLQDVLFDVGQSRLRSGAKARLDQLASVMRNFGERRVLVEGFTDSTGSDVANVVLSERRAQAVRDALVARGIPASRIDFRGHGSARPVASNDTAAGRQQNRRVEIVFSDAQGLFPAP